VNSLQPLSNIEVKTNYDSVRPDLKSRHGAWLGGWMNG
jgi:hypothetical protein